MGNVSGMEYCYGCGVCAMSCGKRLISIRENQDGFYTPYIDNIEACSNCGLCSSVCSYSHDELALNNKPIVSVGAWSKDANVRRHSSSGGVCYEFEKYLLAKGYKICLVRYNVETQRAEHYIADNLDDLVQGLGSKYIQSYTLDALMSFKRGEKYLVVGSPCQIDSLRRYAMKFHREEDFALVDFFCHGVPSALLWKKYISDVESRVGKISYVSWRNKFTGWHDSWAMSIDGEMSSTKRTNDLSNHIKGEYYSLYTQGDPFFEMFLCDSCFNKACYSKCKFKYHNSSADVRVGDFWGNTYKDEEAGVSSVVAFTEKGKDMILNSSIERVEYPFEVVAEGQMKRSLTYSKKDQKIFGKLKENVPLSEVVAYKRKLNKIENWKNRVMHPKATIVKILNKFCNKR